MGEIIKSMGSRTSESQNSVLTGRAQCESLRRMGEYAKAGRAWYRAMQKLKQAQNDGKAKAEADQEIGTAFEKMKKHLLGPWDEDDQKVDDTLDELFG